MAYSHLHDLTPAKDDWVVEVRLIRMWEAVNFKHDNTVMGLEMVFLDTKGDSIQAFIRKNHMKKYKAVLEEGGVYAIRNFKVIKGNMEYKVVPNEHRIYFNMLTSVRKVSHGPHDILSNVFFFTPYETHEQRINNNSLLTDIIGCVVGIGDIEYLDNAQKSMKRSIELASESESERVMKITLWGKISAVFDDSYYVNATMPVIAAITSTTIKKFSGELAYGSTTATRIYFDPEIPEARLLRSRFGGRNHSVRVLETQRSQQLPLAEQMVMNRKTIRQILEVVWVPGPQEHTFTILAKIEGIDDTYGWCYASCTCKKKVVPVNGAFFCTTCNKECPYPIICYKIHVEVSDASGNSTFVVFNEDAEKLLNRAARTYVAQLGIGSKQVPKEITDLTGKSFVFRLKLTDYNLKDDFENYTVTKIFQVDEAVEARLSASYKEKVIVSEKKCNSTVETTLEVGDGSEESPASATLHAPISKVARIEEVVTPEKKESKRLKTGK